MWDRFTQRAKRAIKYGNRAARRLGCENYDTEHLLLGVCSEPECIAWRALENFGVDFDELSTKIEEDCRGDQTWDSDSDIAFTPLAKGVLEEAVNAARRLSDAHIGTEHILHALVIIREGGAAKELQRLQIDHARLREELSGLLGEQWPGPE